MRYNVSDFDWPRVIVPVCIAMERLYNTLSVHIAQRSHSHWLGHGAPRMTAAARLDSMPSA